MYSRKGVRRAFCVLGQFGIMGNITTYRTNVDTAAVRRETMDGREWLVVPVVALVEGVVNGAFVSADELARSLHSWNGRPVPVGHPQKNGQFISANSPDVIEQDVIGNLFNVSLVDNRLKGEMWLDVAKAERLGGDALDAVNRLEAGELVDVSTAYYADLEPRRGTFNGKQFTASQHNLFPDHLAILLHEPGACSVQDGCGAPRVNQKERTMEPDAPDSTPVEPTDTDIITLTEQTEVDDGFLKKLACRLGITSNNRKETVMDELIQELVSNEATDFTEEELRAMPESALRKLKGLLETEEPDTDPAPQANEDAGSDEPEPAQEPAVEAPAWFKPYADKVDKLDEALRGIQANAQAQESQEREQIVNRLVANSACDLTPDEMQDMPLNVLRKLDNGYRVRNYAGRGLSFASNSGEEEEVLAMPPLVSENGNGGK